MKSILLACRIIMYGIEGEIMYLYDGQIYVQIPSLRIGVAVEEAVCYNFRINPRHSTY